MGSEPRQNPVFMFLPSTLGKEDKDKDKGDSSGEKERERTTTTTIIRRNVVKRKNGTSRKDKDKSQSQSPPKAKIPSTSPKGSLKGKKSPKLVVRTSTRSSLRKWRKRDESTKRGQESQRQRPAAFRLPTTQEERRLLKGGERLSLSPTKEQRRRVSSSSPMRRKKKEKDKKGKDPSPVPTPTRITFTLKPNELGLLNEFKNAVIQMEEEERKGEQLIYKEEVHQVPAADVERHMKCIRNEVSKIFLSKLQREWETIKYRKSDKKTQWIHMFFIPAVCTANSLFSTIRKNAGPKWYIGGVRALKYLRGILSGMLIQSKDHEFGGVAFRKGYLDKFYLYGFRAMMNASRAKDGLCEGEKCDVCEEEECYCDQIAQGFFMGNIAFHLLGIFEDLAGPRLYAVIKREIASKVKDCKAVDKSHMDQLMEWLNHYAKLWYSVTSLRGSDCNVQTVDPPEDFKHQLIWAIRKQYGEEIIQDLFAVIIEYPESKPLLNDLRECFASRSGLVQSLKSTIERRLLNAGVSTADVLEAYIATVRALKYLDPTGILVQLVTPPVREYLKHREETVRVILISLTEETGELSEELIRNPISVDRSTQITVDNYKEWNPDPIDVPRDKHNLRQSDLIEAMVSIYGSRTVFIDEYRALLADRLLRMPKPSAITREIKCLELLKLRFGEGDLQKCEVMLKDVSDSQRLNTRFYEEDGAVLANEDIRVAGLIVSAQFWPNFKQENLVVPGPIQAGIVKYTKAFEAIKGNRTLEWQKHIGMVELEIEHGKQKAKFNVTPIHATIIWHFQEKKKWKIDDLAKEIGTSKALLKHRIGFWVSKGVLCSAGPGAYVLSDTLHDSSRPSNPAKYIDEADSESPMASTSSQKATELQAFWTYIEAMLTNLESLPLPRIHSMLKLFATVECSSEELQKFLDDKVSQNLLVFSAGQYQLPK